MNNRYESYVKCHTINTLPKAWSGDQKIMNFLKVLLFAALVGVSIAINCNYGVAGSTIKEIECESPYLKCMM